MHIGTAKALSTVEVAAEANLKSILTPKNQMGRSEIVPATIKHSHLLVCFI